MTCLFVWAAPKLPVNVRPLSVNGFLVWVQKIAVVQTDHLRRGIGNFLTLRGSSFEANVVEVIAAMEFDPRRRDGQAMPKRRAPISQWHGVIIRNCAAAKLCKLTKYLKLATTAVWKIFFCSPLWSESHPIGHSLTCSFDTAKRRPSEQTEHNNLSHHHYSVFNLCHLERLKAFSTRILLSVCQRFNYYSSSLMDVKECQSSVLTVSLLRYFTVSELHRIYSNISKRWDNVVNDEAVGWTSEESWFDSRWMQESFCLLKTIQAGSGAHHWMITGGFYPAGKGAEMWNWLLSLVKRLRMKGAMPLFSHMP